MKEIWKDVPNYEGLYSVSNLGEVKSLRFNKLLKQSPHIEVDDLIEACKGVS